MAYLKWKPIKVKLDKAINYIMNENKTEEGRLVTSYMCDNNDPKEAAKNFLMFNKFNLKKNVLAHHLIQSFKPGENITPEKAHELGLELCKRYFGGERQFIISTHVDKGHIHNHIIFNSYSLNRNAKKFDNSIRNLYKVRELSNKISKREQLNVIENKNSNSGKSYFEYVMSLNNISWKQQLQLHLTDVLEIANNFEELKKELLNRNWKIEKLEDNYIFTNLSTNKKVKSLKLGKKFQVDSIEKTLEKNNLRKINNELNDFSNFLEIKEHSTNKELDKYITQNNLIQMGKIENYLKENNLTAMQFVKNYINLQDKLEEYKSERQSLIEEKEKLNLELANGFSYETIEKLKEVNKKIKEVDNLEFETFIEIDDKKILKDNILKMYNLEKYYKEEKEKQERQKQNQNKKHKKQTHSL